MRKQSSTRNNHGHKKEKSGRGGKQKGKDSGLTSTGDFGNKYIATPELIWWRNARRIDPFPQRWRTVLTTAIRGNIPAGTGPVLRYVRLNSCNTPFASASWPGALPAIGTLNPTGFTKLCNANFYQNFRVHASRIKIEVAPVADIDVMVTTVTPSLLISTPADTASAQAQQFTVTKIIQRGQPSRDSTLTNKISCATLLGVTERAITDDLSFNNTGSYAQNPLVVSYWIVNMVREDGAVTNSNIGYRVLVEHDVEFWGDSTGQDIEAIVAAKQPLAHSAAFNSGVTRVNPIVVDTEGLQLEPEPWGPVEPSKFLDAYLAAREVQKKTGSK
jgi:hypothetical protein